MPAARVVVLSMHATAEYVRAALRAGASPGVLLNADVGERLAPLAAGPLGVRAAALAETAGEARSALRGFASKLLTFDVLVDSLSTNK